MADNDDIRTQKNSERPALNMPLIERHQHSKTVPLDIDEYGMWFKAIINNNVQLVRDKLQQSSKEEKDKLTNSYFDFKDDALSKHPQGQQFKIQLPLSLAIAAGSIDVAKSLVESGMCVCQKDCRGNNMAHNLITQLYCYPQQEQTIVTNFNTILAYVDNESLKVMLHAENEYGLRPLEYAAQHGCSKMFQAIMDTPGVYLHKEGVKGVAKYTWYDVTDYEGFHKNNRRHKSPLLLFTFADKQHIMSNGIGELLERPYMIQWCQAKFFCNLPFILLLLILRLGYIAAYFAMDMDTSWYDLYPANTTTFCRPDYAFVFSVPIQRLLRIYLAVHAVLVIILDMYETFRMFTKGQWHIWKTVSGTKSSVAQVFFYRYSNFIFSLFVIAYLIEEKMNEGISASIPSVDYMRIICPVLAVWSIMYFIQLLPSIGHFVVTVQVMLTDLLHFLIIYGLIVIPFLHSFQIVINSNTKEGCTDEFTEAFQVVYSVFRVMLNMLDFTQYSVTNPKVLYLTHMAFTFLVSIMMINFFIALMSNSVNSVYSFRHSVVCIQRRAVAFCLEQRCSWVFTWLYKKLQRRKYIYEGDKVLLLETQSILY